MQFFINGLPAARARIATHLITVCNTRGEDCENALSFFQQAMNRAEGLDARECLANYGVRIAFDEQVPFIQPGSWTIRAVNGRPGEPAGLYIYDEMARAPLMKGDFLRNPVHADLLASAPDLLAALHRAVELLKIHGANVDEGEPILAAIAKAEGRAS